MVYLLCFFFTVCVFYFASLNRNKILLLISLLIPCILAGLRDFSIGIDVTCYVTPCCKLAKEYSLTRYMACYEKGEIEVGYLVFIWIITKILQDIGLILFTIEFIILLPFYLFFYSCRDCKRSSLYLLFFLLLFYNVQLCVVRQFLAVSLFFMAILFYLRKSHIFAIVFVCLSLTFHNSISILMGATAAMVVFEKFFSRKQILCLLSGLFLIFYFCVDYFLNNLYMISSLDKYFSRLDNSLIDIQDGGEMTAFFMIAMALYPLFFYLKGVVHNTIISFFPLIGAIIQLFLGGTYFMRLTFLFMPFLPYSIYYARRCQKQNLLFDYGFVFIALVYWYAIFIERNSWATSPYLFR